VLDGERTLVLDGELTLVVGWVMIGGLMLNSTSQVCGPMIPSTCSFSTRWNVTRAAFRVALNRPVTPMCSARCTRATAGPELPSRSSELSCGTRALAGAAAANPPALAAIAASPIPPLRSSFPDRDLRREVVDGMEPPFSCLRG